MEQQAIIKTEWGHVLGMLPGGLEASCEAMLALVRKRQVASAQDLLRICLGYGLCDMSLRQLAAWCAVLGLGNLSDVAIMKRAQGASHWLGHLVLQWLHERGLTQRVSGWRVRVLDATTIQRPGAKGTDLRLRARFDLAGRRLTALELTDAPGGETFKRHRAGPGEVFLGDRGYAHAAGIAAILRHKAHVVARGHWQNWPLTTAEGKRLDTISLMSLVGPDEIGDGPVYMQDAGERFALRMIVMKKSGPAAEKERQEIRHAARKKGRGPDPRSLQAAGYVMIVTDLDQASLPTAQALELYRFRWQIEIAFKRLKRPASSRSHSRQGQEPCARLRVRQTVGSPHRGGVDRRGIVFFPLGIPPFPRSVLAAGECRRCGSKA